MVFFTHSFFPSSSLYLTLFSTIFFPSPLFWFLFSLSNSAINYVVLYQLLNLFSQYLSNVIFNIFSLLLSFG